MTTRPFRTPHHTASRTAIVGGGQYAAPGEISLAHLGVLFLDELPEYPRSVLESLRQPLEDKVITITRTSGSVRYPADFMLVATKNPCPCGFLGDPHHACTCTPGALAAYAGRLSGPLLDRIDLVVHVGRVDHETLLASPTGQNDHALTAKAIARARSTQTARYRSDRTNASLSSAEAKSYIKLSQDSRSFLTTAAKRLDLSARAYFRLIRVARSIADLDGEATVSVAHLSEALRYRLPPSL